MTVWHFIRLKLTICPLNIYIEADFQGSHIEEFVTIQRCHSQ